MPEVQKEDRPKWDNKFQYILSCIGFAVGLGNVWRFPYLCQLHGGGYIEECHESTAVNYFWYRRTLNISSNITESGTLQWWLVLCLAICWTIVYICTIRGIDSTGKAIYVTALFPYLVLTIFLIRGLTLPGAIKGLIYLFTPNLNSLKNPRVWLDAATQIFFSLSLGFGGIIALSSYNSPKNDCEKDAVTIVTVNSMTSLYASIPIFSVLGFKATAGYWDCLDSNIISIINEFELPDRSIMRDNYTTWHQFLNLTYPDKIAGLKLRSCDLQEFLHQSASGTGLAFIVFTEAIILMPGSQGWAVLFFIMLFSLGLSTMFGTIEGILTPFSELGVLSKFVPKDVLSALCFTVRSGSYWLEIFDNYAGSLPLLIITFFEVTGVVYIYGIKRIRSNDPEQLWLFRAPIITVDAMIITVMSTNTP